MDDRVAYLLRQRSVKCTIRKSPADVSDWWRESMTVYNALWARPDRSVPNVRVLINELFTMIKYVAQPNNLDKKRKMIQERWSSLKGRIDGL